MFGTILISAITVMHGYVFWRSASVPLIAQHLPKTVLLAVGAGLWILFFLGRVVGHGGKGPLAGVLEMAGMTWMAILFLLFVSLFAADLVTGFGLLGFRWAPAFRGWALLIGFVLSGIALVQGLRPPVVRQHEVRLPGLPPELDGATLVAMSDLHVGPLRGKSWLEGRVAQVRALRPDLVVLLGDLFEGHGPPSNDLAPVFGRLSAPLGVWAVSGNHEFYGRNENRPLAGTGIQILHNRWTELRPGLILAGVDDLTYARRAGRKEDLIGLALAARPAGATILLSHSPWQMETAAEAGVGLMLSGHTHGGQIWPFGYAVRLAYPLIEGAHRVGAMTIIICRGTGTWGPRMRLWHPSEMLHVTLRTGKLD